MGKVHKEVAVYLMSAAESTDQSDKDVVKVICCAIALFALRSFIVPLYDRLMNLGACCAHRKSFEHSARLQ